MIAGYPFETLVLGLPKSDLAPGLIITSIKLGPSLFFSF